MCLVHNVLQTVQKRKGGSIRLDNLQRTELKRHFFLYVIDQRIECIVLWRFSYKHKIKPHYFNRILAEKSNVQVCGRGIYTK